MTTDEELDRLEERIRQLKIEYDVFFNGGSRRPPNDTQRQVEMLIKKFSDNGSLTVAQRFRYNGLTQRHAIFAGQWRQRLKFKEEGPRLTAADLCADEETSLEFRISRGASSGELQEVDELFAALLQAKRDCGENTDNMDPEAFKRFVQQKTSQLKRDLGCEQVGYLVTVEQGHVKLKARAL